LVNRQDRRRTAIQTADGAVGQCTQLDPGYILDAYLGTIFIRAYNHVTEFFSGGQTIFSTDLVCKLRTRQRGWSANLTGRSNHVLFPDGISNVGHCQAKLGQLIRFDPYAHGIVAAAQHAGLTHTLDTCDRVEDVDGQVITLEVLIVAAIGGIQAYQQQGER